LTSGTLARLDEVGIARGGSEGRNDLAILHDVDGTSTREVVVGGDEVRLVGKGEVGVAGLAGISSGNVKDDFGLGVLVDNDVVAVDTVDAEGVGVLVGAGLEVKRALASRGGGRSRGRRGGLGAGRGRRDRLGAGRSGRSGSRRSRLRAHGSRGRRLLGGGRCAGSRGLLRNGNELSNGNSLGRSADSAGSRRGRRSSS